MPLPVRLKDFIKAPGTSQDYGIDWEEDLEPGETITLSTWALAVAGTLVLFGASVIGKKAITWVDLGEVGKDYVLVNTITTSKIDPLTSHHRQVIKSIGILVRHP